MNTEKIQELKEKAPDMLKAWVDSRIDNLTRNNPSLAVTSTYLKRGARNYIDRETGKLGTIIDDAALFLVGDDGRLDINTVFADMMKMLAAMDEVPFGRGIIRGTIGKGVIRVEVPDGPVWGLLFGNTGAIKLTADDFNALRNIVASRLQ